MGDTLQPKTRLCYLAALRIVVGIQFLRVGWPKVAGGRFLSGNGHAFADQMMRTAPKDPLAWHRAFIMGFVVPHAHFFSYLVAFGEVAIAISLITGCLVRVSSSFGASQNANIYFAVAFASGAATMMWGELLVVLHIVFVCSSAGRVLGIDGLLKKRFPRSWLF